MKLAIFPLQLIAFPGEKVNLHIFEQRYRQLFSDLENKDLDYFGIPPVLDNKIYGIGTRLKLLKIVQKYPGGEMDISAQGLDVFRIDEIFPQLGEKLYAGAEVEIITAENNYDLISFKKLVHLYDEFQTMLPTRKAIENITKENFSFQIGHYSGLSEQQKLDLLSLDNEELRQDFMIEHFEKIMPTMKNIENTRQRIQANGHFKNLQSFKFTDPNESLPPE